MRSACLRIALLVAISSCSQERFRNESIHYPTSPPTGSTSEIFSPGIFSTDAIEHSSPAFSADGKKVLWSIVEKPSWKSHIVEMNHENGHWSTPQRASFGDPNASDIHPSFAPDGRTLYFSSNRNLPPGHPPANGNRLWMVQRTEHGWSAPTPLDATALTGGNYSPSVSASGDVYFTNGAFRSPDWNICLKRANEANREPTKLPAPINSDSYEDGPFIAPDDNYLIFESDRAGGIEGSIDLYITFKSGDGNWGAPVSMGPMINSSASERFASVSPDGRFLFFGSDRRKVEGIPNFDIYWIDAAVISTLRADHPPASQ